MKIKVTDLSLFDFIEGNRGINKRYIQKLKKSIEEDDMLEQNPLIAHKTLDGRYELVDGQHRLEAAKSLLRPVWVETVSEADLNKIHLLNTNRRNWDNKDYIDSYIKKGITDYQVLKDFVKTYKLSISLSTLMLMDSEMRLEETTSIIRMGKFKVNRFEEASEEGKNINALSSFVEGEIWHTMPFITAVKRVWERIGVQNLYDRLLVYPTKMRPRAKPKEYLRDFEDRVNY